MPYQPAAPHNARPRQQAGRQLQPRQVSQRARPWFRKKRFIFPLVFLLLVGVTGAAGLWYMNATLSSFNEVSTPPPGTNAGEVLQQLESRAPAELGLQDVLDPGGGSVTVLLMGVDARSGESIDISVRPDSLSVLHIGGNGGTCRTLSIPRDTRVNLPGYGQSKVNHALSVGGIPYQELVVEQFLGIEIDHFALIDFAGMAAIVDAIGGVTVTNPEEFSYEGVTVPAGQPTLNGEQALVFARFRGDAEGDFGRQSRQQELMQAVLQQTSGLDIARMAPTVLGELEGHFKTDLKATSLISLVSDAMLSCASGDLETASMDGTVGNAWDELEGMELSFVQVPDTEVSAKVGWLLDNAVASTSLDVVLGPAVRRHIRV